MKILFVLEHYYPNIGGVETLFQTLAEDLASEGHEVNVITTRHSNKLNKKETIGGVNVRRVSCFNRFLFTFFSFPVVLKQAKNCDLIHTSSYNAALPASLAGWLRNKRVIITFHEVWGSLWWELPFESRMKRTAFFLYEQFILKLPFFKYVAISEFTKSRLRDSGIPDNKIIRIYNGLQYEEFKKYSHRPPQKFTYTFFGRLGISKGLDILLPAAQIFYHKYPESRLKLILPRKPGSLFRKVIRLIDQLDLQDHILLLHNLSRDQLFVEISRSSCVVVPSYSEGFGFVAAESIALNVPVISSQKGALEEIMAGKYLPIKPFNSESLSNALIKARKGEWEELPERTFRLDQTVKAHLELYTQVIDQKIQDKNA